MEVMDMDMVDIISLSTGFGVIHTMGMATIIHAGAVGLVGGMDGMVFIPHFIITILLTIMDILITIDHITIMFLTIEGEETTITMGELPQEDELALLTQLRSEEHTSELQSRGQLVCS